MEGILDISETNRLQRITDFYERRNDKAPEHIETVDCLETIQFLLSVINRLEISPFRSIEPLLRGHVAYFTGRYDKVRHALIIAYFSNETDPETITKDIIDRHPALFKGFKIDNVQLRKILPDEKRTFVLGVGI